MGSEPKKPILTETIKQCRSIIQTARCIHNSYKIWLIFANRVYFSFLFLVPLFRYKIFHTRFRINLHFSFSGVILIFFNSPVDKEGNNVEIGMLGELRVIIEGNAYRDSHFLMLYSYVDNETER